MNLSSMLCVYIVNSERYNSVCIIVPSCFLRIIQDLNLVISLKESVDLQDMHPENISLEKDVEN